MFRRQLPAEHRIDRMAVTQDTHCALEPALAESLAHVRKQCNACGACLTKCTFLKMHGLPKTIAETYNPDHDAATGFECSLCGLCEAICPRDLKLTDFFLNMRRQAIQLGRVDLSRYKTVIKYEKRGNSSLFSYYGLPDGCDTVFFPGCTLPGTRPGAVEHIYHYLKKQIPDMGIVLACCGKISHDLGRRTYFEQTFGNLRQRLVRSGIRRVLTACPNCFKVFKMYGRELSVDMVYGILGRNGLPLKGHHQGKVTIHDPCPLRFENGIHNDIRDLVQKLGYSIQEMKHRRARTLCCGEGGSVGFVNRLLARNWSATRSTEAGNVPIVTYCAGCAGFLAKQARTLHIADVLFTHRNGNNGIYRAPFTYLKRLQLKQTLKKQQQSSSPPKS